MAWFELHTGECAVSFDVDVTFGGEDTGDDEEVMTRSERDNTTK